MNYFGLVIPTFPSAFFPLLSPSGDPHQLQFQLLGTKAIPKAGLLSAGLYPLLSDRGPGISPRRSRAAHHPPPRVAVGSCLPACTPAGQRAPRSLRAHGGVQPRGPVQTGAARGGGGWSGAVSGVSGQVQHWPCCRHGAGWAAGERWYLTDFPTPRTSSLGKRTQAGDARWLPGYCINRKQAAVLAPGYRTVQINPQRACPTQHGCCWPRRRAGSLMFTGNQAACPGPTRQDPLSLCLSFSLLAVKYRHPTSQE